MTTAVVTATVDEELVHLANVTRDRAHSLRIQAESLPVVLANSYRRRASELELEAYLIDATAGVPQAETASPR